MSKVMTLLYLDSRLQGFICEIVKNAFKEEFQRAGLKLSLLHGLQQYSSFNRYDINSPCCCCLLHFKNSLLLPEMSAEQETNNMKRRGTSTSASYTQEKTTGSSDEIC